MKSIHQPGIKRQWFRIGPGLVFALIVAAVLVASGQITRRTPLDPGAGSIVLEADSQGHLRRVSTPSIKPTSIPRLWKPEVVLLLAHGTELRLNARQRVALNELNAAWLREKAQLEREMKRATSDVKQFFERATPERGMSTTQVASSLGDYSALSQQYDQYRVVYWTQANKVLTYEQRQWLDKITKVGRRN